MMSGFIRVTGDIFFFCFDVGVGDEAG